MKPNPGKIKDIGNMKKNKKEVKTGSVMLAHVECAKRTFNVLAFFFFSRTPLLYYHLLFHFC